MSSYWSSLPGVPSATTTRKTTCNLCTTPITKWYKHDPFAAQYKEGEIVALHESVHAPIDLILKEQGTSRETLEVTSGTSKGPRPAIIAGSNRAIRPSQNRPLPATTRVYLLTSYNKIHTSKLLPSILKDHFVVPVSPHCEVETSRVHLHTSPEWQDENIWVIVTKFESFGTIAGRWHYVDRRGVRQNDLSFIVAEKDMSKLHTITQARLLHWNARCAAIRDYAGQCGSVYQVCSASSYSVAHCSCLRSCSRTRVHGSRECAICWYVVCCLVGISWILPALT